MFCRSPGFFLLKNSRVYLEAYQSLFLDYCKSFDFIETKRCTEYPFTDPPNQICRHFPTLSVLRRHPAPSRQQFEGLLAIADAVGIELKVDNSKKLAESLDCATREVDPYFNKLLRILSTRWAIRNQDGLFQ